MAHMNGTHTREVTFVHHIYLDLILELLSKKGYRTISILLKNDITDLYFHKGMNVY
jgi:hypothetical protein